MNEKRLLDPGWAGEVTPGEVEKIKAALKKDRRLRTAWGFTRWQRRPNDAGVAVVAMLGDPADRQRNAELVAQVNRTGKSRADGHFPRTKEGGCPVRGVPPGAGPRQGGFQI